MVTISDIAKALGVTPSTVSRALAGSPRVKESTRKAVEQKARELGYERNEVATSLRRGRIHSVGIIVPRISRAFFGNVIGGAEAVLDENGYSVIICQTHELIADEIKALKMLRSNRVSGVLISHAFSSENGDHILDNLDPETILVQFDRIFKDVPGPKIVNDNFKGAYQATCHLVEQGYRRIGTVAGFRSTDAYVQRIEGYCQALKDKGMEVDERLIFQDSIVRETGYEAGKKAMASGCDAVYCAGDYSALGVIDAVREAGRRIPEDFGVVGTADEQFASLMSPSISSLAQHPYEIGRRAAQAFLDARNPDYRPGTDWVPMDLIVRESSCRKQ